MTKHGGAGRTADLYIIPFFPVGIVRGRMPPPTIDFPEARLVTNFGMADHAETIGEPDAFFRAQPASSPYFPRKSRFASETARSNTGSRPCRQSSKVIVILSSGWSVFTRSGSSQPNQKQVSQSVQEVL